MPSISPQDLDLYDECDTVIFEGFRTVQCQLVLARIEQGTGCFERCIVSLNGNSQRTDAFCAAAAADVCAGTEAPCPVEETGPQPEPTPIRQPPGNANVTGVCAAQHLA